MMPLSNTTARPPEAALRPSAGGGLRYALISTAVVAAVISVTLIADMEHSLPRSVRERSALRRVPDVEVPRAQSLEVGRQELPMSSPR